MFFKKKDNSENIVKEIYKKYRLKRYAELLIGLLLISVAFNLFLLPNNIVFGGVSGISMIVKQIFGLDPSIFILITSAALLVVSYIFLGKETTGASIVGSILYPVFVNLTSNIQSVISLGETELLLSAIFGGVIYGLGMGLVFKAGFTTGGSDIVNQILSKYFHISIGNAMLITDGIIVLSGVFVYGSLRLYTYFWWICLYSILSGTAAGAGKCLM